MRILEPDVVSLSELQDLAALARNRICRLYLHWTAGRYGEFYDDYHLNIDADGNVYRTCCALTDYKPHTWQRNTGSIGITLCCGFNAQANNGYDVWLGLFAPTPQQLDSLGRVIAVLVDALALPLNEDTVLTHCEAAFIDGYGPFSGDTETRWDLWYLRDLPGDGLMKPGGFVLRGKGLWYYGQLHQARQPPVPDF